MPRVPMNYPSGLAGATLSKRPVTITRTIHMKIRRTADSICIELPPAEAKVLLDELAHVRGGARLPKIRQVVAELEAAFSIDTPKKNKASTSLVRLLPGAAVGEVARSTASRSTRAPARR